MLSAPRNTTLLGIILAIYTLLLVIPALVARGRTEAPDTIIGPIAGIVTLFCVALYLMVAVVSAQRKRIDAIQKTLDERDKELADSRYHLEQAIDKRTFEIGVVNASLNREIAERLQAETKSKELQKQMELILNSAGEGIFGLDTDGNVTFVNTAATVMLGWSREELIGRSHHDLVHHHYADGTVHDPNDCPIRQAYRDGIVHASSDDVFWARDGTRFPVEYVSTPIIDNSVITGAVVVFRDQSTFS